MTVSGSCVGSDTVTLFDGGIAIHGATATCWHSAWSMTVTLGVGSHTLTATQTDSVSGLPSVPSAGTVTTVYAPPAAPQFTGPTSSTSPVPVTGTGVPGDTLTLVVDSHTTYTVTIAANGTWSFSLSLSTGSHSLSATQTSAVPVVLTSSAATMTVSVHH